jgi:MFS family permease
MTDVAEIEPVEQPLEEEEPSMIEKEEKIAEIVDPSEVGFLRKGFNQNIIAGIVAFTGPGLFNALQGLGNAGGSDPKVAATMNATLYATFSIFGILSGSLFNLLGTKILMSFGALTYGFYAISVYLWGQVDDAYAPMAIVASAILGLGAACLWGAQGTMTLSYALENQKGLYFGIFWLIFNMGGVMGGFISFGINSSSDGASSVTPETYFTFCGLMVAGAAFAFFFVLSPSRVVKSDGTAVVFEKAETAEGVGELREVAKLFKNRYMLLLTPLIIQSNFFYAYEFGGINGLIFDAPTRGLNSAIYWLISGVSSYVCGTFYLDRESLGGRRKRAISGLLLISAINIGQWVYAIVYQFSTGYDKGNAPEPLINYRDGGAYAAPMILFMYCGLADSFVQTYAYWIIGAISNSPKILSRYVGYYKGIQSFGACLAWIIEAEGASYRAQLIICTVLAVIFIPPTYMVAMEVQDKGSDAEDEKDGEEK